MMHDRNDSLRGTIRTWLSLRASMVNTTIVISAGFGLLVFGSFPSIAIFGGMTAMSLWVALAADLWLLPVLLVKAFPPSPVKSICGDPHVDRHAVEPESLPLLGSIHDHR